MRKRHRNAIRHGAAAVELAFLLRFLVFLFVVAVDYSRIFYYSLTVSNCARNGAIWAADPYSIYNRPYTNVTDAALADAQNISPTPTVTTSNGNDGIANYVDCTVTYTFSTVSNFPGITQNTTIVRTCRLYVFPRVPN